MKATVILEERGIKELITKEYKVDANDIHFVHGLGFVSAVFESEVEDRNDER